MGNSDKNFGMGWIPDHPDFRNYAENHEEINMNELIVREALRHEARSIKVKSF